MSYTIRNVYDLGVIYAGKTLNAQVVNDAGANVGSAISSLFREVATGIFEHVCSIPDNQAGFLRVYATDAPSEFVIVLPINPIEIEANAVQIEVNDALVSYGALDSADLSVLQAAIADVSKIVAANNPSNVSGSVVNIRRATTIDLTISNIAIIPVSLGKTLLTIKEKLSHSDSEAILQIKLENPVALDDGITIFNKQPATSASGASITVTSNSVTIHIDSDIGALLKSGKYKYDIKFYDTSDNSYALAPSDWIITEIVTNEV